MRYSTYEPNFSANVLVRFFASPSPVVCLLRDIAMNATPVEIQRIQTRLQQLGRSKSSVSSTDSYESSYESSIATQSHSVELNDDTMRALRHCPDGAAQYESSVVSRHTIPHQEHHVGWSGLIDDSTHANALSGNANHADADQTVQDGSVKNRAIAPDDLPPQSLSTVRPQQTVASPNPAPSASGTMIRDPLPGAYAKTQLQNPTQLQHLTQLQNPTQLHNSTQLHNPTQSPSNGSGVADPLAEAFEYLNTKAQYVNAISHTLKTALRDMGAIAQTVDHQLSLASVTGHPAAHMQFDCSLVWDAQSLTIPHVEQQANGAFVVKAFPVGDVSHQRHAENLAQQLRSKSTPSSQPKASHHGLLSRLIHWLLGLNAAEPDVTGNQSTLAVADRSPIPTVAPPSSQPLRTHQHKSRSTSPSLMASIIWLGGSMLVRMGLDALLVAHPILWPLAIALVVTPAAIAIYRTAVDPQSSVLLGRRLLLIMIGLLLGGRL